MRRSATDPFTQDPLRSHRTPERFGETSGKTAEAVDGRKRVNPIGVSAALKQQIRQLLEGRPTDLDGPLQPISLGNRVSVTVLGVDTTVHPKKEVLMELTVQKPEEDKVDFAVLYGGKVI